MRPARVSLPQDCEDTLPYVTNQYLIVINARWLPFSGACALGRLAPQRGTRISAGRCFSHFNTAKGCPAITKGSIRVPPEATAQFQAATSGRT